MNSPLGRRFMFLDRDKFAASFAADMPKDLAAFMADSQSLGGSTRWRGRFPN